MLARITPTADAADLRRLRPRHRGGVRGPALKAEVFAEIAATSSTPDALLCSNTSTLPITGLADGVDRPDDFIGLHFFSPVDKMPLVEIIQGEKTSRRGRRQGARRRAADQEDADRGQRQPRLLHLAGDRHLRQRGPGHARRGRAPDIVERAATQAGYPVGTLQLSDELNLELMVKIRNATKAAVEREGGTYTPHPAERVVDAMIEAGRPSKLKGAGFYEYAEGRRAGIWPGLAELFPPTGPAPRGRRPRRPQGPAAVHRGGRDRTLLRRGRGRVRRRGEHRLDHGHRLPGATPAAPPSSCRATRVRWAGLTGFVARARELAAAYGERFRPRRSSSSWRRRAALPA